MIARTSACSESSKTFVRRNSLHGLVADGQPGRGGYSHLKGARKIKNVKGCPLRSTHGFHIVHGKDANSLDYPMNNFIK